MDRTHVAVAFCCFLLAAAARADDTFTINTDTATLDLNGSQISSINGVPVADGGVVGSVRRMWVLGDLVLAPNQILTATGARPLRLMVAGSAKLSPQSIVRASATPNAPGPGGGAGAAPGVSAGTGGAGGNGGATIDTPDNGSPGFSGGGSVGGFGGEGGDLSTDGGNGGSGNTIAGMRGSDVGGDRIRGGTGVTGSAGGIGRTGGRDFLNTTSGGAAGSGGPASGYTPAAISTGGQGTGGSAGGGDGSDGAPGLPGDHGTQGQPGTVGGPGANLSTAYLLGAGSGGGSGGGGSGGGGGAGGSAGGAGGGGGSGSTTIVPPGDAIPGGGGGGGAGAPSGGNGGDGGDGGLGGSGGHGGGAFEIYAAGLIEFPSDATFESLGSEGQPGSPGDPGLEGTDGGTGATGGQPGSTLTTGGHGGNSAQGGRGGSGNAGGTGGPGGGGGGGTCSFVASLLSIHGDITTSGGGPNGMPGRLMYGHNSAAPPITSDASLTDVGVQVLAATSTPRSANLYTNVSSPLICPTTAAAAGLLHGPAPFGYLPTEANTDARITAARAAPPGAVVAFLRYDLGPAPFAVDWEMTSNGPVVTRFDLLVVVNVSGATVSGMRINTQTLREFPTLDRSEFGGDDAPNVTDTLASGDLFALLLPESSSGFTADVRSIVPEVSNQPFTLANGEVAYFLRPCAATRTCCDADFNADGNADQDDVACLVAAIAGDASCTSRDLDFNLDGNTDQDDLAALINVIAGGPCP